MKKNLSFFFSAATYSQPRMLHRLFSRHSLLYIYNQQLTNEIFCVFGNRTPFGFREVIVSFYNLRKQCNIWVIQKRRIATKQYISNNTGCLSEKKKKSWLSLKPQYYRTYPHIDCVGVRTSGSNHLRSYCWKGGNEVSFLFCLRYWPT